MLRMTFPGQPVPEWLEKVEVRPGGHRGIFTFGNINVVWMYKGWFYLIPLLPFLTAMEIKDARNVTIRGQGRGVMFFPGVVSAVLYFLINKHTYR